MPRGHYNHFPTGPRRSTRERHAQVLALHRKGLTDAAIAKQMGNSAGCVSRIVRAEREMAGLAPRPRGCPRKS